MGKKVLEVKDLVTTFRIGKKEYEVLRGVSFDIEENETLCMVGESGCGKSVTTLSIPSLTMLSRVIKPRLMVTFVGLCIVGMCISGYVFNFLQPLF